MTLQIPPPTFVEREIERRRAEAERDGTTGRAEQLAARLRAAGIDPDRE